jgi:S-DNA-T family DNA segregation ATPase FtsK/SpoIIIE
VACHATADGVRIVDCGVKAAGSIEAGVLIARAAMAGLGLALASYTQTDPSGSTASGSPVENWMGLPGAWAAERVLLLFGLPGVLLLPLLYVFARRLWDAAGDLIDTDEDDEDLLPLPVWWRLALMLALAMALLGTALALAVTAPGGTLPAGAGGLGGLLGAAAIRALAHLAPAAGVWIIGVAAAIAALAGLIVTAQVFAFDWHRLPRMPAFLRRGSQAAGEGTARVATLLPKRQPRARAEAGEDAAAATAMPEAPA